MEPSDQPSELVVCDAGPLIHLDEFNCLDLLAGFREILVPLEVSAEVHRYRPSALSSPAFLALPVRFEKALPPSPDLRQLVRAFSLDAGEVAAMALQAMHPASILLTDRSAARLAATALGRRAHGTLDLLLRSLRRYQKQKARPRPGCAVPQEPAAEGLTTQGLSPPPSLSSRQ